MRGATRLPIQVIMEVKFQSTRPMRGATPFERCVYPALKISIHAPHAGRDWYVWKASPVDGISIHAPHAGRDFCIKSRLPYRMHFNPRAPCGARPAKYAFSAALELFQSTRPMRGATLNDGTFFNVSEFQSTRPMRGATRKPESGR